MKIPINDEFSPGDGLQCFTIFWPDTPRWIGLLQGLLTTVQQGRFWDEKTGSIKDMQAIGRQIEAATLPLVTCEGIETETDPVSPGGLASVIGGWLKMECSLPYGALKYIDGVLNYRYCGEWYPVEGDDGAPEGNELPSPDDPNYPDVPTEAGELTPCSQAWAIHQLMVDVVDRSLDGVNSVPPRTPPEVFNDIAKAHPEISWGTSMLLECYLQAVQIEAAGLANETESPTVIQNILCEMAAVAPGGPYGWDEEMRKTERDTILRVVQRWFPYTQYATFAAPMQLIWVNAYRAIGAKDTAKITQTAYNTEEVDCDCPNQLVPVEATENGWYLGDEVEIVYNETGGVDYFGNKWLLLHDIYGVWIQQTINGDRAGMGLKRMAASNVPGIGAYDAQLWGNTSDNMQWQENETIHYVGRESVGDDVMGAGNYVLLSNTGSDVVGTPWYTIGTIIAAAFQAPGMENGESVSLRIRLMHNINSPSHS